MNVYETISDDDLIARTLEGDDNAFAEIIRRYEGAVAATVINMVGHDDADEVGQVTMIKLYNSLSRFKGDASLKTYVTRIAINSSLDALRRRKRLFSRFFSLDDDGVRENAVVTDHGKGFELKESINRALSNLKPEFRAVAVLRLVQGYSTEEVSNILGIASGTVLSRLSRARKILSNTLREEENG